MVCDGERGTVYIEEGPTGTSLPVLSGMEDVHLAEVEKVEKAVPELLGCRATVLRALPDSGSGGIYAYLDEPGFPVSSLPGGRWIALDELGK